MKMVSAVIPQAALDACREALSGAGCARVTISEVRTPDWQAGVAELYRGHDYPVGTQPMLKLELAVADEAVERVVAALRAAAGTAATEHQVLVLPLDDVIRIRNGEHGEQAL